MIVTGTQPITIPSGQSLSNLVKLDPGQAIIGIAMSSAWDAANLTFQATLDPDAASPTYADIYTTSAEYSVAAGAGRFIAIPPTDLLGIRGLRVRSGTSGAAVNQTANRTLTLVLREV